jgi:PAS domain S-box-containing protein
MNDLEFLLDTAAIITRADAYGKIIYVNKKFEEISGYSLEEVLGKDHNVVNSGTHPKSFWNNMYKTVIADKGIWNAVCTNQTKDGSLYHVDTYIKGEFDESGKLTGFISIRQDVTELADANKALKSILELAEDAKEMAEKAKNSALNDLEILQQKSQTELIGTIVKVALYMIVGVGIITSLMYGVSLMVGSDTQIIGSTWSNMFGILLTNAFSIVGTIMGVKYASEKNNK